jgi:hypothetical protein
MSSKRDLTRAELVRRRRAERTVKELEQTKKRALKPIVPVTSRTPTIPLTSAPKRTDKSRRFNIALGLPEIHLHKPNFSIPRFRGNWRFVSLIVALVFGIAVYLALTLPYFYVPAATVLGNDRLSKEEVNAALGVMGQSIFTVQPQEVETRLLLTYPELLSAKVDVYLPNHVYVTVTERQPLIFWEQEGEGYTWIDSSGVAFRPRGFVEGLIPVIALDVPPAGLPSPDDPLSPPPFMKQELVDAVLALSPLVPDGVTMTFSSADGLGWADPRGWQAAFGTSAHDMPLKIRVYQSLVESLVSRRTIPEFISVEHPDGPFYRMAETGSEESTEELSVSNGQ